MIDYSSDRRLDIIFSYNGTVLPRVSQYALVMVIWSLLLLEFFHLSGIKFELSPQAHSIVGVALGLLLVFRTNTSYDRYWEGRKQLGALCFAARNLISMANAVIPRSEREHRQEVGMLLAAFIRALRDDLRESITMESLGPMNDALHKRLSQHSNKLNGLLSMLNEDLRLGVRKRWMHPSEFVPLVTFIGDLQAATHALRRIRFTPLPFAYVNQLKVFMAIYFLTLPLVLIPQFGYMTLIIMAFIVYALVGVEEIGIEIEDPFGDDPNDLPVIGLTDGVLKDIQDVLERPAEEA
jgi:putative membrane protein